jgi:mono/diheme cytochrome c family protein
MKKIRLFFLSLALSSSAFAAPDAGQVKWLDQGWTKNERDYWHYKSLGQALAPVSWLKSIERNESTTLLMDRTHLEKRGFLFEEKNKHNPNDLPIGFAVAPKGSTVQGHVGLSCSACHTSQIQYQGKSIRIDGGSANFDISDLLGEFYTSLYSTFKDKDKWNRFVARVQATDDISDSELNKQIASVLNDMAWNTDATSKAPGLATEPGPGRADALNRIGNYVFGQRLLEPANYHKAQAPANYPPLWNIWRFNWVHYNASFSQPMARNILQVLGNNGTTNFIDSSGNTVKGAERWKTSIDFFGAAKMEEGIRSLSAPKWPAEVLGSVDQARINNGKKLFEQHCLNCHGAYPVRPPQNLKAELAVVTVPISIIGTDPAHAKTYHDRKYNLSKLSGDSSPISGSAGLEFAIDSIQNYVYDKLKISKEDRDKLNGFGRTNQIRGPLAYKARTLEGIWATPPYLHNGSVPNMYELLSPVAERSKKFWTGSYEFDPMKLGYVTSQSNGNYFLLDTSLVGNSNSGHEFNDGKGPGIIGPKLSHNERMDLIEYLKVLDQKPPLPMPAVDIDWEWISTRKP